jgi:16S rRNA pseudouridine516 synthase
MRLDRWIGNSTALSRLDVRRAVKNNRVCVNGLPVKKFDVQISESDTVTLDGQSILAPQPRYFMLHKPAGFVCANTDGEYPTVLDLLCEQNKNTLQIAGRLDVDTTGLVLLTDDGAWNHRVTAPSRKCEKSYRVVLQESLGAEAEKQLQEGIVLRGETQVTQPAKLVFTDVERRCLLLTISEGKYHQVKRMFAATGNHVLTLHREKIGIIVLDENLAAGTYRPLTAVEIKGFC